MTTTHDGGLSSEHPASADDILRGALEAADLRTLLMALFHITGDFGWLEYRPCRDVNLIADEGAGFSRGVQQEIRSAAYAVLKVPTRCCCSECCVPASAKKSARNMRH